MLFGGTVENQHQTVEQDEEDLSKREQRRIVREKLAAGELENEIVTIEIEEQAPTMFDLFQGSGIEQMGMNMQDALSSFLPKKKKKRKVTVSEARKILTNEEANKLIDMDEVTQEAIYRAEQTGIIFIDEIDKIASKGSTNSADISRRCPKGYFTSCRRFDGCHKIWTG